MPIIEFEQLKESGCAEIYIWHITENCEELSALVIDGDILFSEAQTKFKSKSRQREWLAVRALLCHTPYKKQKILYHDNGQPYLDGNIEYISISHTKEYAAIAISKNPIGLDLETLSRNAIAVAKAFLTPKEIEDLFQSNNPATEVLQLWSAKEAAFKLSPKRNQTLKDISAVKNGNIYSMTYSDGTTATAHIRTFGEIIISYCLF